MIPQIQIPDFAGGIMRAEQAQASRLQQLAMQREFEQGQAVDAALANGGAAALFGADQAAQDSVLARLSGLGRAGLGVAMPIFQQRQQRVTPMTPEQAAALGLRPGTVAMVDGLGRPQVIQTPDTASPEAEAQKMRIAAAGRQPPAPTILGPGQVAIGRNGQVVASGPPRPAESPFEASQGGDAQILSDLGPLVASGQATPAQQRLYSIAATRWQSSGQQMATVPDPNNPGGTLQVAIPRPLPPGFPAPPPLSAPIASPAAAPAGAATAPQQQGNAAPSGAAADPNAPRTVQAIPQRVNNEPMSAEAAARVALVREGVAAVDGLERRLLSDRGVDRPLLAGMWAQVPAGEAAQFRNLIMNAVGNRLRIETGAAATQSEIANMAARYMPRPWDSEETIRQKMTGLRAYFGDFERMTAPGGRNLPLVSQQPQGGGQPQPTTSAPPSVPRVGEVRDGWRFRGGNPADQNSWERAQ